MSNIIKRIENISIKSMGLGRKKIETGFLYERITQAIKRGYKFTSTINLLGTTVPNVIKYLEKKFKPGMTWENHGKWHIDHIRPCAHFDLTDTKQQLECFHYTNLQPLWAFDNMSKGAKIISMDITSPKM